MDGKGGPMEDREPEVERLVTPTGIPYERRRNAQGGWDVNVCLPQVGSAAAAHAFRQLSPEEIERLREEHQAEQEPERGKA